MHVTKPVYMPALKAEMVTAGAYPANGIFSTGVAPNGSTEILTLGANGQPTEISAAAQTVVNNHNASAAQAAVQSQKDADRQALLAMRNGYQAMKNRLAQIENAPLSTVANLTAVNRLEQATQDLAAYIDRITDYLAYQVRSDE